MVDTSAYDPTVTTVISGVITGIAVLCTALRFYVRVHGKAGIAWDDWWILAGLLSYLLTAGLLLYRTLAQAYQGMLSS
ncbi:hypothetical protein GJ744_005091 [Endocarpon pusillum]|uniref:Uncharacterized protein n=1 Tax=Endocarpon pusillum TaxID=364733 RepID=A0A8H7E5H0_9EURO|nr:hypothetical protein GJ744_005091 [Endocarpon pusillum]